MVVGLVVWRKGGRYLAEKIDEIVSGAIGEVLKLPRMGSGVMELDGDPVVEFTGIWRNKDRLAVRSSKSLTSSHARSCSSSEGESFWLSYWSGVLEVSGSGVLVFLKCWRLQGSELGFLCWFKMVKDYNKDSLEKDQARPVVTLALGKGKCEH